MDIAIDLTSLSYHITGIERYALCISQKMLELDQKNHYILLFRDEIYDGLKRYIDGKRVCTKILRGDNKLLFNQVVLPYALYKIKADRYLFLAFPDPILFRKRGIYSVIHDMGAWDRPDTMKILQCIYLRSIYWASARSSQKIITVSNFSKQRILKILKITEKRICVVPCGVTDTLKVKTKIPFDQVKQHYGLPERYIMSLSTLEPRKNMRLLIESFLEIKEVVSFDLVLVGRNGWMMDGSLSKYDTDGRIRLTGFVKDEEVSQIYKHALCFVFPSSYEGFGMPPLEALTLGSPVISSDAASMPEILMDQATYFKDNDKEELKKLLIELDGGKMDMARSINEYQRKKYNFTTSAKKILRIIGGI